MSVDRKNDPNFQYGRWLSSPPPGEEVVISGMSGRLPNSDNIEQFRANLFSKTDMVSDDDRRWDTNHPEIPKRMAKINDIDRLDAGYFGLHYRQVDNMDPMMRTFMPVAIEAIMDAGINPTELEGSKTGVFVGVCWSENENDTFMKMTNPQQFAVTGYERSLIAQRISYHLKLKGPSCIMDSACSSSLNAFDSAFKAIRSGRCDNALVGCANLLLHPGCTLQFFRLGVLSKDGSCKVFDQNADGYVRSETVACIMLQKAKNSKRIYAQVVNSKVNSDGFKEQGITFPSSESQQQLMTEIYEDSGIHPNEVSFLEAHGTGTQVGDPEEVEAIDSTLGKKRDKSLLVGSVKSSIGHGEPSSGICSIIKVLIAMETGWITPNINLKQIKETLTGFKEGRLKVVTDLTELEGEEAIVGINNFGFGGTNCHIILKRFNKNKINNGLKIDDLPRLVCVSGRTEQSVLKLLNDINGNNLDSEHIGLLHQIYRMNIKNHIYRGFTIISKDQPIKASSKLDKNRPPFYIFFGQFINNYKILATYLSNFSVFKNTISRIDKILLEKNLGTFGRVLKKQDQDHFGAVLTQIGFVDVLKLLNLDVEAVYDESWRKLISSYYYGTNDLEESVSLASERNNFINEKDVWSNKLQWESFDQTPKNCFILNVSDSHLPKNDVLVIEAKEVNFLNILGRLYEQGHNPQLHKLYPEINYPVSRGTPMVSPLIQWNHNKSWFTYKFQEFTMSDTEQREFTFNFLQDEQKFIAGHVIDGRNLLPATQYLVLVWQTFTQSRRLLISDVPVIFEDCKFVRAVTMPQSGYVKLLVTIQRGTGTFEVIEKNSLVVSGRISMCSDRQSTLKPFDFKDTDSKQVLEMDEIYKELQLRGYNYSGVFKGLQKCNVDATRGYIKWENNWVSFMDKMLQMMILHADTRFLFVPVAIKKIVINPLEHLELASELEKEEHLFPLHVSKECDTIRSGGIEICKLEAKSISKKKQRLTPVLEKHEFVPNCSFLNLSQLVRVNTQIIEENTLVNHFKAVEIIDDLTNPNLECLLPFVCNAIDDIPMVTSDLTISTKTVMEEVPGVKIEEFVLKHDSDLVLIIVSKVLQRPTFLKEVSNALKPNGYILTREDGNSVFENFEDFELITEFTAPNEKLILLKKTEKFSSTKSIEVTSKNFDWISDLQKSLQNQPNIIVYSKNEDLSGILGLVNCLRHEPSGTKVKCFFMMDPAPEFDPQNVFYKNQIGKNLAVNVYKNGNWGTYRHLLLEAIPTKECEQCYANFTSKGDLTSLKWFEGPLRRNMPMKEGEMLVETYYSAINFKDVMVASGRINVDTFTKNRIHQESVLGMEFSGTDLSGRRVTGMTHRSCFSTYVVGDTDFLWEVPNSWTLEDAATVPVVYSTVLYSLQMVAELKPGSSILIHSATGGIGIAALNVCLYYRCDVYVTVGTKEKREFLKKHYPQIPDSHIGNSRDLSFENMIKTETNGRGVDLVLNSLSEDKLQASVRCLARGGSLLEIGKFDMANNSSLSLLLMEKEISYHGVMLDHVFNNSSIVKRKLSKAVQDGINDGFVKPLPLVVFNRKEIEVALRYMMTGKHIGKVLMKMRETENEETLFEAMPRFNCDEQKCYVITGGLGGIGLELADWLMLRRATKIVLVSRSGIRTGYQTRRINNWKSYGVDVRVSTKDITTLQGCRDLIEEAKELGPIDAIFNLAALLKDALFEDQTEESFLVSLGPKAQATIFLDQVSRELCPQLRHFVIFSSVSCGRGNASQTNYGMANSVMERLCEKRKLEGLPAVAIQWGAIGDVGLVAKMQKENKELVIGGTLQQKISSCLEVLDTLLQQNNPVVASMVVAEKHNKSLGLVSAAEAVAYVLGIKDIKTVSQHATLAELGMDSMMGTEILQILEKDFDIYVTAKDVRSLTFAKLNETEAENKSRSDEIKDKKSQHGANLLIQNIVACKNSDTLMIKLESQVKDDQDAVTVIVLPGIEGTFGPLEPVTRNLNAHVIGAQYRYYDPEDTIEEMAKNILPRIKEYLSRDKSFVIIGYSFGAVVGIEVVKLLENEGYDGKIISIDGSPTYLVNAATEFFPAETSKVLETAFVCYIASNFVPIDIVLSNKKNILNCEDLNARLDLFSELVALDNSIKEKLEKQAALTTYKHLTATLNYKIHDKIKSSMYLFKAKYPMYNDDNDDYHLSKLCEKPVQVTEVDGDHVTMLQQSYLIDSINKIITDKGDCI